MARETKHTQGKWKIDKSGLDLFIDGEDWQVCIIGKENETNIANAEHICRAVNNHYRLVEALKIAKNYMDVFIIRGEEPLAGENIKTDSYNIITLLESLK